MKQARVVDINVYYRTGGADYVRGKTNFDLCIIQAGVGLWKNPLLGEQIAGCRSVGWPYATYHIPDPIESSVEKQVDAWASWPGVADALMIPDIEHPKRPGSRLVNAEEARRYIQRVKTNWIYSRVDLLTTIWGTKLPDWLTHWMWIAWYPYQPSPPAATDKEQYWEFEPFLTRFGGQLPPTVIHSKLFASQERKNQVGLWQFSEKGDAQSYLANAKTKDPVYKTGILSCDLSVSTIEKDIFMGLIPGIPVTPAPAPTPNPAPQPLPKWARVKGPANIRNAPMISPLSDVGDVTKGATLEVLEDAGEFWRVSAYVAKSVTEVIP
jgi:hypothetical protein